MTDQIYNVPLICAKSIPIDVIEACTDLIEEAGLPLTLDIVPTEQKLTQKTRKQLSDTYAQPVLIIDEKQQLSLLIHHISVAPSWQTLQRRIVSAGRKSELILQAAKLNEGSRALDATAGFGHDSLILASTGAKVTMLERNPLIALLLIHEKHIMSQHKNWQKLMTRLNIIWGDAAHHMQQLTNNQNTDLSQHFDVVYLDPMFPDNSYEHASTSKGAKVGKHMQALHHISNPPDIEEESRLLNLALITVNTAGRVVVKRSITASLFANKAANQTWQNDVIRFDGYFANHIK